MERGVRERPVSGAALRVQPYPETVPRHVCGASIDAAAFAHDVETATGLPRSPRPVAAAVPS